MLTLTAVGTNKFSRLESRADGKKKEWLTYLTVLLVGLFVLPLIPTVAQAGETLTLIAEESFDYTGNLVGKDGGTGFTIRILKENKIASYGQNVWEEWL
jgi:hypothetical protein